VADAVAKLRGEIPGGERLPTSPMVAVNQEHVLPSRPLADGDELAFLPPLAGG
jgi:molybdopterin converting factor small subunit